MNSPIRNILTVAKREFTSYFTSPVAYVFLVIFLLLVIFLVIFLRAFIRELFPENDQVLVIMLMII